MEFSAIQIVSISGDEISILFERSRHLLLEVFKALHNLSPGCAKQAIEIPPVK